jgi:D-aminopeptidase
VTSARPRARDLGLAIGSGEPGPLNAITDVEGVRVGHTTLDTPPVRTGVTVIVPHGGNVYREKVPCSVHVINGFGKATGLSQLDELGTLETPIALTNTLCVGAAFEGLVRDALARNPEIGTTTGTVNPVVAECNDQRLNDLRGLHVRPGHVIAAIEAASSGPVAEGSVGAGTGMVCYGWKGGIGTASRHAKNGWTVGVLVLANFGRPGMLTLAGVPVGARLDRPGEQTDDGSCVTVIATDAPADSRQLGRVCRRAQSGLARTGTFVEHGSGEYVLAFTTAARIAHFPATAARAAAQLAEDGPAIDALFEATTEAVEEAVVNALFAAGDVIEDGRVVWPALPVARVLEVLTATAD